jgi:hypothetical protein
MVRIELHGNALFGHCFQSRTKSRDFATDSGIVLYVVITIEEAGYFIKLTIYQNGFDKVFYQCFVLSCFIEISCFCWAI